MTLHGLSDAFLTAIGTDHQAVSKVEVWSPSGVLLDDISDQVTDWNVQVDETREIRRTLTLTPEGTTDLVPADLRDLLHPATCNEIIPYRGVQYPDGSTEFAQCGVFRTTKPVAGDDGATISLAISGQDRASVIAGIPWLTPYPVRTGTNPGAVIQTAMESIFPGLTYHFDNVQFGFDSFVWGATPGGDPMADFITFAATAGCELFFDPLGIPTFRQIINPLTSVVLGGVHFVDGENCTAVSAGRTLDETTARNGIVMNCNGIGSALPFKVEVWDTNPGSPTYYLGPWGRRPSFITTTAIPAGEDTMQQAMVKATKAAFGQLQLILGSFDDASLTAVPNPALREGDCAQVTHPRLKIDNAYVISTMTIPGHPNASMPVTFRPRISAS